MVEIFYPYLEGDAEEVSGINSKMDEIINPLQEWFLDAVAEADAQQPDDFMAGTSFLEVGYQITF